MICFCLILILHFLFFKLGFTPYKAEQGIELQKKKKELQKD